MHLAMQFVESFAGWKEQETIDARKIALDAFGNDDGFDAVDGGGVALGCESRALLAEQPFDFVVPLVQGVTQMSRGTCGFAAAGHIGLQHDDGFSFARQEVSVGPEQDGYLLVVAGLRSGQRVVTDGCLLLQQLLK